MSEKIFNTRIQLKHDVEANWNKALNFIPKIGEIIIYDIDENYNYSRFKIGDGVRTISNIEFSGTDLTGYATESYVNTAVASLINSAPEALNTLDELAAALGDDENFATTVTNQIATKLDTSELPTAINTALAQAKASGEFDGEDGYSPVRGTDYWTDADKAEIKSYVDEAILGGAW